MSEECKKSREFTPFLLPKSKIFEGTVIAEITSKYLFNCALNIAFAVSWLFFAAVFGKNVW